MACLFFMPCTRHEAELWAHRQRLPLGDGFSGRCMAPGRDGIEATDSELKQFCNLGYASGCPFLPREREADVVRFAVARDGDGAILLNWVFEREHLPANHGTLEYDAVSARWTVSHRDARVQRMAECFVESYVARHPRQRAAVRGE